jgi:anionic cell wall polymer biosynthesis LytR-Cps2A-Psr (LCP) family protein
MLEEETIKQNKDRDDFTDLESALTSNLDHLYDSGFVQEETKEDEKDPVNEDDTGAEGEADIEKEDAASAVFSKEAADTPGEMTDSAEISEENKPSVSGASEEIGSVSEADEEIFKDIDQALATQIRSEIKRERRIKRLKRSKWWLLSLIPVIGIFVLFIRPLRKHMPVWFMILRTLVFIAFALEVIGTVASDGRLLYYQGAAFMRDRMAEAEDTVSARPDDGFLNPLFIIGDETGNRKELFVAVLSFDQTNGSLKIITVNEKTAVTLYSGEIENASGQKVHYEPLAKYIKDGKNEDAVTAVGNLLGIRVDGYIYADIGSVSNYVDKLGTNDINSNTFDKQKSTGREIIDMLLREGRYAKLLKLLGALKAAAPGMKTDLNNSRFADIISFFAKTKAVLPVYYTVPEDGSSHSEETSVIWITDTENLKNSIKKFIYGEDPVKK